MHHFLFREGLKMEGNWEVQNVYNLKIAAISMCLSAVCV